MAFTIFAIGANLNLLYIYHIGKTLAKAHASAHKIVDQQHATLLGPTCCVPFAWNHNNVGTCCVYIV